MGARDDGEEHRFVVTGGPRSLRPAAARVADVAVGLGIESRRRDDIELAVHEALANALEHGHGGRGLTPVEVEVERDGPTRVVARVTDLALGAEATHPDDASRDRGHGRALMRAGSDDLRFTTGRQATTVELTWCTGPDADVRAEHRPRTR